MYKASSSGLALALVIAIPVFAQDTQVQSRADVKAETRALEKAGKLTPAGEGSPRSPDANFTSTKTRSERKAETRLAAKNHELTPTGSASQLRYDNAVRAQKTTTSRGARKAETRLAEKQGRLTPAGEGPDAPKH